ncbi:MAG: hypothetical protein H0T95_00835 [Chthoniobacterales bacterium]|nr:hypothetical protein [Chthoniobacterales bacterium]
MVAARIIVGFNFGSTVATIFLFAEASTIGTEIELPVVSLNTNGFAAGVSVAAGLNIVGLFVTGAKTG